ncbi:MAG: hypothetical protein K8S94_16135 [Planctomycetia bacterium]|nr:hypothetical protein [Planctomycetia bacterium]
MQPADMPEIEGNDLAKATMSLVERIRPHLRTIAAAIGLVFVGLAAWTVVSSQRDAEKSQSWDACLAALSTRDAGKLGEVAARYPGSSAAVWSQILLADNALAEGGRLLFTDKVRGRERLQAAADLYAGVMSQRPVGMAAERAVFGLAKARESLGELAAAKQGYEALVVEHPRSPLVPLADSRIASLDRPATAGWYDWFEKHDAKPATTTESASAAESAPAAQPPADGK